MQSHKMYGLDGIVLKLFLFLGEELLSWFLSVAEAARHRPFDRTEEEANRKERRLFQCYFGKNHFGVISCD